YKRQVQGALRPLFDWMLTKEFGDDPRVDFLVILDREYWLAATDLQREILVYHELCHCQQAIDKFGEARFDADGLPVWSLRGHDVEEFVSVVQRYGAHNGDLQALVRAAGGTITQRDS
ncbi:MAG: putative metallopeptidase, partial [Leptothrix sp. (in: b-proteobacteria)]